MKQQGKQRSERGHLEMPRGDTPILTNLPALMTMNDIGTYLQLSENVIRRLVEEEGLPIIRFGKSVRFNPLTVRAWALSQQTPE